MKRHLFLLIFSSVFSLLAGQTTTLDLSFSHPGGPYERTVTLQLSTADKADIFYTIDGSLPNLRSKRYRSPIKIEKTRTVRAIAHHKGQYSEVQTHSFLIQEPTSSFPILSISTDPWRLFDIETGLFMQGAKADTGSTLLKSANFWSKKEIIANLEFYEVDEKCVFNGEVGFKLFGGVSRLFPQKSIALSARSDYGEKKIKHKVFGKKGPKNFNNIVLRNSGSDFGKTHIRDAFITQAVKDWEVEVQNYRPAHVYLNGDYWGIYNIREKVNPHFIANYYDVDKDSIDLLEHNSSLKNGNRDHYLRLIHFLKNKDLSKVENYAQVKQWMEVESFIDWQIAQIFFDNRDAGGNIRYWRPQSPNGRWRWILFDMDWGMGLHNADAHNFDSFAFYTEANGPRWPNPPWSTLLFRKLLESEEFKQVFITRFSDHLNGNLKSEHLLQELDRFQHLLEPEIGRHLKRWNLSKLRWKDHFNRMRNFAQKRPEVIKQQMEDFFQLSSMVEVHLRMNQGGKVVFNRNLSINQEEFSGKYYKEYPLHLSAQAHLGYRFLYWENDKGKRIKANSILLNLKEEASNYTAVFEPYEHPLIDKLVINEIAPNNKASKDWIELYNSTKEKIDLSGFALSDLNGNLFQFPEQSYILPNDYLILCENRKRFLNTFPRAYNVIGGLGFGINKRKESLELFDKNFGAIDSVAYALTEMDTIFSYSLLLPHLNNSENRNWQLLDGQGTPGQPNPFYVQSSIQPRQSQWLRISFALGFILLLGFFMYNQWIKSEQT